MKFPTAGERIAMLDEACTVIRKLWTEDASHFKGKYFELNDALCEPKPVQKPHPPIVIGGTKPKILRVIARHANEWNAVAFDTSQWALQSKQLDEACAEVGRDPAQIRRGVQLFLHPTQPGQIEQQMTTLPVFADAGCEHVVLSFYQPPTRAQLETVAPK